MLKTILFDFNGVIINDEPLHEKLIEQLLIEENLRLKPGEFQALCLGRSDRACLTDLLTKRGRVVTEEYLLGLLKRKSQAYQRELEAVEELPIYPGVSDLISKAQAAHLPVGIVSGALRSEIELVLTRTNLITHFSIIVAGDDIQTSKPDPTGYLLAVDRLNQQSPQLAIQPQECLAIEDTFAGIEAAKQAGMQVVGVANTYPFHMLQRQANWTVDYLTDLELDRVQTVFAGAKAISKG